jgi:DNA-binding transcriptional regulator GbsR (MarR family)
MELSSPMSQPPSRDPRSERLDHRVQQVCSAAGTLIEYWGFKSILGRVWTFLALRAVPLPQTEIADSLGVSKSLVSGAITELAGLGLVRPVGDGRNAPWEAVMDVWPVITDVLRTREWLLLESTRLALEQAIEETHAAGPAPTYDARRMALIRDMVGAVQRLLGIVISIRMPGSATGVQEWIATATALIESLRAFGNAGKDDRRPS